MPGWGIIWEPRASAAADDAELEWTRANDVIQAIEFALMRDPNAGKPMTESGLLRVLVYSGALSIDQPTVVVTYEKRQNFEGQNIIIHDIEFSDPPYGRIGNA